MCSMWCSISVWVKNLCVPVLLHVFCPRPYLCCKVFEPQPFAFSLDPPMGVDEIIEWVVFCPSNVAQC